MTKYRHVVDHQRHQPPVQAENNAHLPHGAQYRARQPWGKRINELVAVGQQMAQPGGDRANHQKVSGTTTARQMAGLKKFFIDDGNSALLLRSSQQETHEARIIGITDEL